MISQILVEGYLGRDAERSATKTGLTLVKFSIGTTEKSKDRDPVTHWHDIIVWGRYGDMIFQSCRRGAHVIVNGTLRYNNWEDKNGGKHKQAQIHAQNVRFIERRAQEGNPVRDDFDQTPAPTPAPAQAPMFTEEDIPF